jgi:hypothetical protein
MSAPGFHLDAVRLVWYAVNARFGVPSPKAATYDVVRVEI